MIPRRGAAVETDPVDRAARGLLANLEVTPVRNSHLVHVSWVSPDPVLAAEVANTMASAYIQFNIASQYSTSGEAEGFLWVHVKRGSDRILGATLVAEHAGDMIGELCLAVTHGVGLGKIATTIHPYPTQGEVIKKAADAWRRTKLTPMAKRAFGWWFRLTG